MTFLLYLQSRNNKKGKRKEIDRERKLKSKKHEGRVLSYIFGTKIQEEGRLSEDKVKLTKKQRKIRFRTGEVVNKTQRERIWHRLKGSMHVKKDMEGMYPAFPEECVICETNKTELSQTN
jgi:hypothetical protein